MLRMAGIRLPAALGTEDLESWEDKPENEEARKARAGGDMAPASEGNRCTVLEGIDKLAPLELVQVAE